MRAWMYLQVGDGKEVQTSTKEASADPHHSLRLETSPRLHSRLSAAELIYEGYQQPAPFT